MKKILGIFFILFSGMNMAFGQAKMTAEEYIARYKDIAITEMNRTGIPASITLAQGLIESGNGNSYLSREANNHFGIKCKKDWTGKSVSMTDDAPDECFRAYNSAEESYRDHSDFLVNGQRYSFLFDLDPSDYKGWAQGLKQAGYATNPRYPDMLISVIEKYELYQYDKGNTKKPHKHEEIAKHEHKQFDQKEYQYNGIPAYIVKEGDTYESITKEHSLMHWQIRKYNELEKGASLQAGTLIYLKPKKRKAKEAFHTVQDGESMYLISQKYGIKLKRLYKLNLMEKGQEAAAGEKLSLRKKRKTPPQLDNNKYQLVNRQGFIINPVRKTAADNVPVNTQPGKRDSFATVKTDTTVGLKTSSDSPATKITIVPPADIDKDFHTVLAGETLYSVSKSYSVSMENLLEWNNVPDSTLRIGQLLRVKPPGNEVSNNHKPNPDGTQIPKDSTATSPEFYVVGPGETLYSISKKTGVSVDNIKLFNGLQDNSLALGQKLKLSGNTQPIKTNDLSTGNSTKKQHTVQAGETLYSISRQYNISVDQLRQWNGLTDNSLKKGQILKVAE